MRKTGLSRRKSNTTSKVAEWLQSRKKVHPAKIKTALLFGALQEMIEEVSEIVIRSEGSSGKADIPNASGEGLKPLLPDFDALRRGSRKLELRVDAIQQGVTLSREVIENCLHEWQEAYIKVIRLMKAYVESKRLGYRLGYAKALHRDIYAATARILKKKGILHRVTFEVVEEGTGRQVNVQQTSSKKPPSPRQKRDIPPYQALPPVSQFTNNQRHGEKAKVLELFEGKAYPAHSTSPKKLVELSPKSDDTDALLESSRRDKQRGQRKASRSQNPEQSSRQSRIVGRQSIVRETSPRSQMPKSEHHKGSSRAGRSSQGIAFSGTFSGISSNPTKSNSSAKSVTNSLSIRSSNSSLLSAELLDRLTLSKTLSQHSSTLLSFDSQAMPTEASCTSYAKTPSSLAE